MLTTTAHPTPCARTWVQLHSFCQTSVPSRLGYGTTTFVPREVAMKLPVLGMAIVLLAGPAVAVAGDLEDAVQSLKDAVEKKDVDAVKKLAETIRPMTAGIMAEPAPAHP